MSDSNMSDFYGRVARVERAHAKGYGFEAYGTLGRSYYLRPKRQNRPLLRVMLFAFVCAFGLKGMIHYNIGPEAYDARVARLEAGTEFDRVGAWMMQADPVTLWVAGLIGQGVAKLNG